MTDAALFLLCWDWKARINECAYCFNQCLLGRSPGVRATHLSAKRTTQRAPEAGALPSRSLPTAFNYRWWLHLISALSLSFVYISIILSPLAVCTCPCIFLHVCALKGSSELAFFFFFLTKRFKWVIFLKVQCFNVSQRTTLYTILTLEFYCKCYYAAWWLVVRGQSSPSPSQKKVMHFSMTSHHEIFDSTASLGMLGHLGGGAPQSAHSWQPFRPVLTLLNALRPILDPYKITLFQSPVQVVNILSLANLLRPSDSD